MGGGDGLCLGLARRGLYVLKADSMSKCNLHFSTSPACRAGSSEEGQWTHLTEPQVCEVKGLPKGAQSVGSGAGFELQSDAQMTSLCAEPGCRWPLPSGTLPTSLPAPQVAQSRDHLESPCNHLRACHPDPAAPGSERDRERGYTPDRHFLCVL